MSDPVKSCVVLLALGAASLPALAQPKFLPLDVRVTNGGSQPVPVTLTNPAAAPAAPVPVMYDTVLPAGSFAALAPLVPAGKRFVARFVTMTASANNPNFPLTTAVCQMRKRTVTPTLTTDAAVVGEYKLEPVYPGGVGSWTADRQVFLALAPGETLSMQCSTNSSAFLQAVVSGELQTVP